ncbi:MAG: 50S ribosomal protein L29 [Patescibacteria group bacterium]
MKYSDCAGKNYFEVSGLLNEKQTRISELLFLRAQGKLKNNHEIGALRKDIARIRTYLRGVHI